MEEKKINIILAGKENFAKYGQLITVDNVKPDFESGDFNFWNKLGEMDMSETASICMVESYKMNGTVPSTLESHRNTSETLIPTEDIYITTALPGNLENTEPDLRSLKVFKIAKGTAVILSKDIWHFAPMSSAKNVRTFIIFNTNTPEKDYQKIDLKDDFNTVYKMED